VNERTFVVDPAGVRGGPSQVSQKQRDLGHPYHLGHPITWGTPIT
jgi:hypothetical protein